MNGHGKDYADINTSFSRILPISSVISVGTTIVKKCGENIFFYFGFLMNCVDINDIVSYSLTTQHDMCQVPNILCCSQQAKLQN